MTFPSTFRRVSAAVLTFTLGLALHTGASAQESTIRKNLSERLPNMPTIDEVSKTPMPGLYEIRVNGTDVLYTDAEGNYLIQGSLIDTRAKVNLTEERVEKLTAIAFDQLPFADAFTIVKGNGKRKLAVFEDPNCGYCKKFERDLAKIDNVTVHVFLYPILSPDSTEKSKNIWCAKCRAGAWNDWMTAGKVPAAAPAGCDTSAVDKNVALGQKIKVSGTPTIFTADGHRLPGAVPLAQLEQAMTLAAEGK